MDGSVLLQVRSLPKYLALAAPSFPATAHSERFKRGVVRRVSSNCAAGSRQAAFAGDIETATQAISLVWKREFEVRALRVQDSGFRAYDAFTSPARLRPALNCQTLSWWIAPQALAHAAAARCVAELILNAPGMVGSLELFFNVTGLLHSVSAGLIDLFNLPLTGLSSKSLTAFVAGIWMGWASLLRHMSGWTLTSVAGFSLSVARILRRAHGQGNIGGGRGGGARPGGSRRCDAVGANRTSYQGDGFRTIGGNLTGVHAVDPGTLV